MRIDITAIDKTRINKNKQSHPFDETVYTISQRNKKEEPLFLKRPFSGGENPSCNSPRFLSFNGLIAMDEDNCMVYV